MATFDKSWCIQIKRAEMKKFIIALQLLTIIPLNKNISIKNSEIARCSIAFVPVGIIQGIILILVYLVTNNLFENEILAGIILMTSVLYNGGFHIDGLSDTFDGIAMNGDKEKKAFYYERWLSRTDWCYWDIFCIAFEISFYKEPYALSFISFLHINSFNACFFKTVTYYLNVSS